MSKKLEQLHQFARLTADMLAEKSFNARVQIYQICKKIGTAKVVELLKETLEVEQNGGMKTSDGTHRRTPGGVFFALAKRDGYEKTYSPEQKRQLWAKRRKRVRAKKKQDRLQNDDGAKKVVQDRKAVHKNDESLATQEKKSA